MAFRCRVLLGFVVLILLGPAARAVPLVPFTFTIDHNASAFVVPGPPSTRTLNGVFDAFERTLTLTGGGFGTASPSAPIILPGQVISNSLFNLSIQTSTATYSPIGPVTLSLAGGTVIDGGPASPVIWNALAGGGPSSVSGILEITVEPLLFGLPAVSTSLTYSATASVQPTFVTSGTVTLLDTPAGAQLTLPVQVPVLVSNFQFQGGGILGSLVDAVTDLLDDTLTANLSQVYRFGGDLVATSPTHLPPPPTVVNYKIDPALSFISDGVASSPLTGNVTGDLINGELKFAGGSNILASSSAGPIPDFLVGSSLGLSVDIDLESISLATRFDLASGFASHGSNASALDWTLAQGTLTMHGQATFVDELLGGTTIAPFTITSELALDMQLKDGAGPVSLVQDFLSAPPLETLIIPLALGNISPSIIDTDIDIDLGPAGGLLDVFELFLAPQLQNLALAGIQAGNYSGLLVATRAIPAPPTWLLLLIVVPALLRRRRLAIA